MTEMITLKLKNGSDIVGPLVEEQERHILVSEPVEMQVDPEIGFFAKSYLLLAKGNVARFDKSDLMLMAPANEKAIQYYEEFVGRIHEMDNQNNTTNSDDIEEVEETMEAILESKSVTKH